MSDENKPANKAGVKNKPGETGTPDAKDNNKDGQDNVEVKTTFESLCTLYAVRKDVIPALRAELTPKADGSVEEKAFVETLKKVSTCTPQ